jgi:hypothetical protein
LASPVSAQRGIVASIARHSDGWMLIIGNNVITLFDVVLATYYTLDCSQSRDTSAQGKWEVSSYICVSFAVLYRRWKLAASSRIPPRRR